MICDSTVSFRMYINGRYGYATMVVNGILFGVMTPIYTETSLNKIPKGSNSLVFRGPRG